MTLNNVGTTVVPVQISVWVELSDAAHFGMPMFLPRLIIIPNQFPDGWRPLSEDFEEVGVKLPFMKSTKPKEEKKKPTLVRGRLQAELFGPLVDIATKALPHLLESDALGFLGSLDKPAKPDVEQKTRIAFASNWNTKVGVTTFIPLKLDPSAMTLTDRNHWRKGRESDLKTLWSKPTATITSVDADFKQYITSWSTTDTVGTVLYNTLVGPNSELHDFYDIAAEANEGIIPSAICSLSTKFHHWTGGLNYEIEIFATGFHKGSLRFSFHPANFTMGNLVTPTDFSSQYSIVCNLSDKVRKYKLAVPYIAHTPWLEVSNCNLKDTIARCARFHTGIVVISVVKQLISSGVAAPTVDFVVRLSGAPDFMVANLDMHNNSVQLGNMSWETVPFQVL